MGACIAEGHGSMHAPGHGGQKVLINEQIIPGVDIWPGQKIWTVIGRVITRKWET